MARYEVCLKRSVKKDLEAIPKSDLRRIVAAIAGLAGDPRPPGARKLSAAERWRCRCGAYRILYEIADAILIVCVVKVGHRKDVYRH